MQLIEFVQVQSKQKDLLVTSIPRLAAVSLSGVSLTLTSKAGPVEILRAIDLEIVAGSSVSIVGASGSGKTSLLMIMAGLERPSSGRVIVAGEDYTAMSEDQLALARGRDIGIVFQSFHLVPTMTAVENVALPLALAGRADAEARALALLDTVGLASRRQHYPAQLSGGEQQRVALARALAPRPKILFADEPTGNLDESTGTAITELLFGLHREHGATLVLVTHDTTLARKCGRLLRMSDGRITSDTLKPGEDTDTAGEVEMRVGDGTQGRAAR